MWEEEGHALAMPINHAFHQRLSFLFPSRVLSLREVLRQLVFAVAPTLATNSIPSLSAALGLEESKVRPTVSDEG